MGPSARRRPALAAAFARAAFVYWLAVFPRVHGELRHWRRLARAIPDPQLRRCALQALDDEQGNLEGAAAFAAFTNATARPHIVRATVAFQAIYDYVDSLVELPADDPIANGRALHQALDAALDMRNDDHPDYYAHHPRGDDGGYLQALVDACRHALTALPSYHAVEITARRAVGRMATYQSLIHAPPSSEAKESLEAWAKRAAPAGVELRWWETAAGAASSLLVFALIAEAARPDAPAAGNAALEAAFFPWVGALHVLLDSLVDQPADAATGHHSLVANYPTPADTAARMSRIARTAREHAEALEQSAAHMLLLVAMASYYLSADTTEDGPARLAADRISAALGPLTGTMLFILHARRRVSRTVGWSMSRSSWK